MIKKFLMAGLTGALMLASCNKDEEILSDTPAEDNSPVEFTVTEYLPAPGQFINEAASGFTDVNTMEAACRYAQDRMSLMRFVSLGAWGGSLTVKASRSIVNTGGYDFSIAGNSFDSSNEPGIVWVMEDTNGNGIPDDTWYELKGSGYGKEGFEKDYWVTYFRGVAGEDVRWTDCHGNSGVIPRMEAFHNQESYYPAWVEGDSYTLKGSLLPAKTVFDEVTGQWSNLPYEWGYADNAGQDSVVEKIDGVTVQRNFFRISDAVKEDGSPANLSKVDFIRIQTAVMGRSGILGELSTEICGIFAE